MPTDPGLRRLALRTLLGALPGPAVPDWAVALAADGLAGYTLFARNVPDLAGTGAALRGPAPGLLLAIDEEGGDVTRLAAATGSPYPGNAALGAVDDPALTAAVHRAMGAELAAAGVNLDLAPTVDVNTAADNPIIGTRSFGADPALVARHAAAAVDGLQSARVAGCAKHFPGHGATVADSHTDLPTVPADRALLAARDLPPFAAAIDAGVRAVMTAHVRVPALTGAGPATFSRAALVDVLRRELGFTGVLVTDALEMRGAAGPAGGVPAAAVLALGAGADLLLLGSRVDAALVEAVTAEIAAAVGDGRLAAARVTEAARRVADLADWARPARAAGPVPADAALGYAAARRAVRVEGSVAGFAGALVVQVGSAPTVAEGRVPWGPAAYLGDAVHWLPGPGAGPGAASSVLVGQGGGSVVAGVVRAGSGRAVVLAGRHLHRSATTRALVEALAAQVPLAVVEMGWPGPWRPAGARAFVLTFGAGPANARAALAALGVSGGSPDDRGQFSGS